MNGEYVNSRMYLTMVNNFVEAFNNGNVPKITSPWQDIVEKECQHGVIEAKKFYDD